MQSEYYSLTTNWVIFVAIVITIATVWLYRIGNASLKTQVIVSSLLVTLIAFMHWGFGGANFLPADISGGMFFLIILAGALLVNIVLYLTSWQTFNHISQEYIQLAQGLRVFIGGGFLMEGVVNVIPGWFSIMDGFMHISSGFFALIAAVAYVKQHRIRNKLLWLANIVGITDIGVIVISICFVVWGDLGPHHNMHYIVFGGGPILLWLHFVSIGKLLEKRKS